jgi:hypothetical protein
MRVLLADEKAKVRSALRLLVEHQPEVEILGEAVDTTGLVDWVKAVCPDMSLLDWDLPGLSAAALLPLLRYRCPSLRLRIALIAAAMLLGMGHLYQGLGGIVRTFVIGLILGVVLIATGSIINCIILHIIIDVSSSIYDLAEEKENAEFA